MARISVEQKALTDSRFTHLGLALGASQDGMPHALGLGVMITVWNECQEQETYTLDVVVLDAIGVQLGYRSGSFSDAVVASGLAHVRVRKRKRVAYLSGTRGRIEWLAERREEGRKGGKKGGRPRKEKKPVGVIAAETPRGLPGKTPPTPTPTPTPEEEKTPSRAKPKPLGDMPAAEQRGGFAAHAFRTWEAKHQAKPPWRKTDYVALAEAAKTIGDEMKSRAAWDRYLLATEPFFAGHAPRKFLSDLSRFVTVYGERTTRDGAYQKPATPKPSTAEANRIELYRIRREELFTQTRIEHPSMTTADVGAVVAAQLQIEGFTT